MSDEIEDDDGAEYEWVEQEWELRTYELTGREYIFNRTTNEIRPAEEAVDMSSGTILSDYAPPVVTVPRVFGTCWTNKKRPLIKKTSRGCKMM